MILVFGMLVHWLESSRILASATEAAVRYLVVMVAVVFDLGYICLDSQPRAAGRTKAGSCVEPRKDRC